MPRAEAASGKNYICIRLLREVALTDTEEEEKEEGDGEEEEIILCKTLVTNFFKRTRGKRVIVGQSLISL